MTAATQRPRPRLEVVDALRGFAVMAIFLVHNLEHFIFPVYPENPPSWLAAFDQGVLDVTFSLFAGKAYAIFALLFGLTFHIQCGNQRLRGGDFGYRFLWRLLLLLGFATLNAAFFPAGDVLLLFAVVGPVLFFARNASDKVILVASVAFLLQPIEWVRYVTSLFDASYALPDLGVDAMYEEVALVTKSGSWSDFLLCNITLGQKASLMWAIAAGRYMQTAGLFLLGLYLGRKDMFVIGECTLRRWKMVLIVAAVSFAPLYSLSDLVGQSDADTVRRTAGAALDMWQKLAFTLVLVASFVTLYGNLERFRRATSALRFYGRMSLTNYVGQSIMGALVYFPIGLHLAPYCGYTVSALVAFGLIALQILFCRWWLSRHGKGPLEQLWHMGSWLSLKR